MPFDKLFNRLVEKTQGRVLDAELGRLGAGSGPEWDRFVAATDVVERTAMSAGWVDYTREW